jgi:hypothetical protein
MRIGSCDIHVTLTVMDASRRAEGNGLQGSRGFLEYFAIFDLDRNTGDIPSVEDVW